MNKCTCSGNKSRRYYACAKCWSALTVQQQRAILDIGRKEGKGTLRAGQITRRAGV